MLAQILFLMFICFIPSQFVYFIIQVFNFSHKSIHKHSSLLQVDHFSCFVDCTETYVETSAMLDLPGPHTHYTPPPHARHHLNHMSTQHQPLWKYFTVLWFFFFLFLFPCVQPAQPAGIKGPAYFFKLHPACAGCVHRGKASKNTQVPLRHKGLFVARAKRSRLLAPHSETLKQK